MFEWNRPSEENPKEDRDLIFVVKGKEKARYRCGIFDGEIYVACGESPATFCENEVLCWRYAPALPDWVLEEFDNDGMV